MHLRRVATYGSNLVFYALVLTRQLKVPHLRAKMACGEEGAMHCEDAYLEGARTFAKALSQHAIQLVR
jgi:hypothetical protein